ncbi:MarR family transcriptional regulator [Pseudarthrobacter sp. PS3-L1]|uniref:MarR family transcriptional regulator n=1 Tax=Pseudarthrobacter sp. PS3-L1 TaxID=3046207 RepID=UPI0024BAB39F|nr:MarR family transcriptional regulator [Pseudarthrobacter sp. PS3-L1]MDJ0321855.1 MarR family transcriptional regulator [Pseudarthrobacter sp. PS3-L1]
MFVLTIDQRGSTNDIDRVPDLLRACAALGAPGFERSVGDEVQGVISRADQVVDISLAVLRTGNWYVGIGVGSVDLTEGQSPREGSGTAFLAARKAVESAKTASGNVPLSVVAGTLDPTVKTPSAATVSGANAQAVLRLLGRLVQERTQSQWKVVDTLLALQKEALAPEIPLPSGSATSMLAVHGTQKMAAVELGVTEQSISRSISRSGWPDEAAGRPAAAQLLNITDQQVLGGAAAHLEGNS